MPRWRRRPPRCRPPPIRPQLAALRRRWASLIRRVYEVDPLLCPRCRSLMPVVSFRPPVAPGAAAPEKQARDEEGVRKIASGFAEAWNRHDMKALSMLFAEDADFVNVVGLWWKGRSEIEKQHAAAHADWFKDSRLTMTATAIRFLAPDLAVVHPTWDLVGARGPLNLERAPRKGIMIQVMKREGGRWWIVAAQNTDIVPLPGPAPVKTPPAAGGRP